MRNSSAPVKPDAPMMATWCMERTLRPVECLCNDLHTTRTDLQRDTGELGLEILGDALSATLDPDRSRSCHRRAQPPSVGLTSLIPMMPNRSLPSHGSPWRDRWCTRRQRGRSWCRWRDHDLIDIVVHDDRRNRPERLLAVDRHVVGDAGDDGGRIEVTSIEAVVGEAHTTDRHLGALGLTSSTWAATLATAASLTSGPTPTPSAVPIPAFTLATRGTIVSMNASA